MRWTLALSVLFISSAAYATGTQSVINCYTPSTFPSTTVTNYCYPANIASCTNAFNQHNMIVPLAGTIDDLHILSSSPGGSGKQYVFTFLKNGIATSVSTGPVNTATESKDIVDSFSVNAGDTITIQSVPTGTPSALTKLQFVWRFTANNPNQSLVMTDAPALISASLTRYTPIQDGQNINPQTIETFVEQVMPTAGTFKNLWSGSMAATSAAIPGAATTVTLMKNGVATSLVATYTTTGSSATDSVDSVNVVQGDSVSLKIVTPAGATQALYTNAMEFDPTTDGESIGLFVASNTIAQNGTSYRDVASGAAWNATETNIQVPVIACTLKKLWAGQAGISSGATPVANGQTLELDVRDGATNTGITTTFTGTGSAFQQGDNSDTFSASDEDLVNIRGVTSATTGSVNVLGGIVYYIAPAGGTVTPQRMLTGVGL